MDRLVEFGYTAQVKTGTLAQLASLTPSQPPAPPGQPSGPDLSPGPLPGRRSQRLPAGRMPQVASLGPAHGGRATSGSVRPRLAPSRRALLLPPARSAWRGCWQRQAFACRARRPTRFPGDRTRYPTAGTWPGACVSRQPPGHCLLAWHLPLVERQPVFPTYGRQAWTPRKSPDPASSPARGLATQIRMASDRPEIHPAGAPHDGGGGLAWDGFRLSTRGASGTPPHSRTALLSLTC